MRYNNLMMLLVFCIPLDLIEILPSLTFLLIGMAVREPYGQLHMVLYVGGS